VVNDIAELKDPSPFRAALMGHLGKMRLALQGHLQSGDPALSDQAAQSRKDFLASLPEFARQSPRLFPKNAVEEIKRSFKTYAESMDQTLAANIRRAKSRAAVDDNFTRIIYLIDHNIRPLIKSDQPDGEERSEAILNVENQARAWQQNLAKAWAAPSRAASELAIENDSRGGAYLERYMRLELLPRERKVAKEIDRLWQANGDAARESVALDQVVATADTFMESQRNLVVSSLNRFLPAMAPAELEQRKQGYVRMMRIRTGVACLFALLALISLRIAVAAIGRANRGEPLIPPRKKKPVAAAPPEGPEPTLEMDLKGMISGWTPAAETLYGYTAQEMRGKSISKLFESESEISRLYKGLLDSPQTHFETLHKLKSGQVIPVRIQFCPLTDAAGRATAIGLICIRR
jgi:PAS domain S-box-containing protein